MDVLCRGSGKGGMYNAGGNCKGASAWTYYAGAVVRGECTMPGEIVRGPVHGRTMPGQW